MKLLERAFYVLAVALMFWSAVGCDRASNQQGNFIVAALCSATVGMMVHAIRR